MTAINNNRAIRGPVTAVPVVAGNGIRLVADTVNNRWVVEADETVLFEDANGISPNTSGDFPITLSEATTNFERVRFYWQTFNNQYNNHTVTEKMGDLTQFTLNDGIYNNSTDSAFNTMWNLSASGTTLSHVSAKYSGWNSTNVGDAVTFFKLYKVVGINRVASA